MEAIQARIQAANQALLEGHIVAKQYHCNCCTRSFSDYQSLEKHRSIHLKKKQKPLMVKCELPRIWVNGGNWEKCGSLFSNESDKAAHEMMPHVPPTQL